MGFGAAAVLLAVRFGSAGPSGVGAAAVLLAAGFEFAGSVGDAAAPFVGFSATAISCDGLILAGAAAARLGDDSMLGEATICGFGDGVSGAPAALALALV